MITIPISRTDNTNRIAPVVISTKRIHPRIRTINHEQQEEPEENVLMFRFTTCSDPRMYHHNLGLVLQAIKSNVGVAPLHFFVGDIDSTCAENRAEYDEWWDGETFTMIPVVGNHEVDTPDPDMIWMRSEYENGNGLRTSLKSITNEDGPSSCKETMYTIDYENVRFIVINPYWDGFSDSGYAMDAKINEYHLEWLKDKLYYNDKEFNIVLCHEPAYPQNFHVGSSLDRNTSTRDQFWSMLEEYGVELFLCGHTHYYSKYQYSSNPVWQIDMGNAGSNRDPADGYTFLDIKVYTNNIDVDVWREENTGTYLKKETITINPVESVGEEPEQFEEPTYTTTIWNASDKHFHIALEDSGLTAVQNNASDSDASVRSIVGVSSGKWYWEYTLTVVSTMVRIGVGNKDAALNLYVGKANSWGAASNKVKGCNGVTDYTWWPQTFGQGDVVSIALDMDNKKVFVAVNGDWENDDGIADPYTGVYPMCDSLTGIVHAMVTPRNPGNKVTANFGDSDFIYTVPPGYHPGLYVIEE